MEYKNNFSKGTTMKIYSVLFISLISITTFITCTSNNNNESKNTTTTNAAEQKIVSASVSTKGYNLMKQKCFICHFPKPEPSKRNKMIAPPMMRVQQHYKPSFPAKKDFVNAILNWVKNPTEKETLMPGAVRKFKIMPHLGYKDDEIKLIAEALFETDFGNTSKMGMMTEHGTLKLNNNKKWKLHKNTISVISSLTDKLQNFKSNSIKDYNKLGKEVFDNAKTILLDKSYPETIFQQLHIFFSSIEENIHLLISAKDINEARKQHLILTHKFINFQNYFE